MFDTQQLDGVSIRVTNTGTEAITLNDGQISLGDGDTAAVGFLGVEKGFFHNKSLLIEPGQSRIITYYLNAFDGFLWANERTRCVLTLRFYGESNDRHSEQLAVPCDDVGDFVMMWVVKGNARLRDSASSRKR